MDQLSRQMVLQKGMKSDLGLPGFICSGLYLELPSFMANSPFGFTDPSPSHPPSPRETTKGSVLTAPRLGMTEQQAASPC